MTHHLGSAAPLAGKEPGDMCEAKQEFIYDYVRANIERAKCMNYDQRNNMAVAWLAVGAETLCEKIAELSQLNAEDVTGAWRTNLCHRLAISTRNLYAYASAFTKSPVGCQYPLVYDEDTDTFRRATCALCPSEPDSPRLNGLCRSCDMAEHGDDGAWADVLAEEVGL
jgi:hypothetical protein